MDFKDCVFSRRSIRKYKRKELSAEKINSIIKYALYAPSSCNTQNWEFILVKDKKVKEKLSKVHKYCSFVKDASYVIVFCFDKSKCLYSPSGLLSVAVAAENILLGITNEGLGGCWIYVKDDKEPEIENKVKEYLNIPENIEVVCMISVGYPDEVPQDKKVKDLKEVIHVEKW